MNQYHSVREWRAVRRGLPGAAPGFVPTMGALHEGHLALVRRSLEDNDYTVVSIFINPTQFDRHADLEDYPVDAGRDFAALEALGVDAVIVPTYQQIYPDGFAYRVAEADFSGRLCGAHRAGHFDGVLTVVMKLLNLVRPARVYFGEKDYQQLQLVKGMVEAFFMDIEVIACPTVREPDGLAMSSRNRRLDPGARQRAPELYRSISASGTALEALKRLERKGFAVDYVEDLDGRRLAAATLDGIRLIDNVAAGGCHD